MTQKKPLTNAEKQARHRASLQHGGLFKKRDFYLHPDDEPALRALESFFRESRIKNQTSL